MLMGIRLLITQAKIWMGSFVKEERGDFGIGQIAAIVATIVIIGAIVGIVTGALDDWIGGEDGIWGWITDLFKLNTAGSAGP